MPPTMQDFVDAYTRTGIQPVMRVLYAPPRNGTPARGCAVGALLTDRGWDWQVVTNEHGTFASRQPTTGAICARLDCDQAWLDGMMNGFDGFGAYRSVHPYTRALYAAGYDVGVAVRRQLLGEGT